MKTRIWITLFTTFFFIIPVVDCFSQISPKDLRIVETFNDFGEIKRGERWALLIGINTYTDEEINSLRFSVKDVEALYQVLIDEELGMFKPENVKLLTSNAEEERNKPTKVNILFYLKKWLAQKVKKEDTVFIYFSGHGALFEGKKYLLPIDTDMFYIPAYAIDNQEFIEGIDNLESKKVIVVLDSCHSGGVSRSGKGIGDSLPQDFYEEFESAEGKVTLASCSGNEQSFEWTEKGHGVFTYYLIEGLKGAANKDDQAITFGEAAEYVEKRVKNWAQERGLKQTPTRHMENVSGKIAITFDMEKGVAVAINEMKDKMRGFLGTKEDKLSPKEIALANAILDNILLKYRKKSPVSNDESAAFAVISSLVKGELSVYDYKDFSDVVTKAAEPGYSSKPLVHSQSQSLGFGTIKVTAIPWADIYLDGKLVGQTPQIIKNVSAGEHTLVLRNPEYKEVNKKIQIKVNGVKKISEELEKK